MAQTKKAPVKEPEKKLLLSDWIALLTKLKEKNGDMPLEFIIPDKGGYDSHEEKTYDMVCSKVLGIKAVIHSETAETLEINITIGDRS